MHRRRFLAIVATTTVGLAGCSSDTNGDENGAQDDDSGGNEYDSGTIVDRKMSELRDWQVDLVEGQIITVEVTSLTEGDMLQFQVGDGTKFVHTHRFYEDGNNAYEAEGDGQYQIQLHPKRDNPPVNQEVQVDVTVEVSEP